MPSEVVRVALRCHHALPAAARAADEVRVVRRPAIVVAADRPGRLHRQVDRPVAEVLLPLGVVEGPARLEDVPGVPGVGTDGRVAAREGAAAVREERARVVLHAAGEAVAAPHQQPAVPVGRRGQQQLEVDLRLDHAGHPAVRRNGAARRHRLRGADAQVDQVHAGEVGTGDGSARRASARGSESAGGGSGGGQAASNEAHGSILPEGAADLSWPADLAVPHEPGRRTAGRPANRAGPRSAIASEPYGAAQAKLASSFGSPIPS